MKREYITNNTKVYTPSTTDHRYFILGNKYIVAFFFFWGGGNTYLGRVTEVGRIAETAISCNQSRRVRASVRKDSGRVPIAAIRMRLSIACDPRQPQALRPKKPPRVRLA